MGQSRYYTNYKNDDNYSHDEDQQSLDASNLQDTVIGASVKELIR